MVENGLLLSRFFILGGAVLLAMVGSVVPNGRSSTSSMAKGGVTVGVGNNVAEEVEAVDVGKKHCVNVVKLLVLLDDDDDG